MATSTPNYGWPLPQNPDPAQIPKDMLNLAMPIDAALQTATDRISEFEGAAGAQQTAIAQELAAAKKEIKSMELVIVSQASNGLLTLSSQTADARVSATSGAAPGTKTITISLG